MTRRNQAFTLIELVMMIVVAGLVTAMLLPGIHQQRTAASIQGSIDRVRRLTWAAQAYYLDHAGQVPLRGSRYTNGQLSSWDTWECGGKNCNIFWQGGLGAAFDESAYSRPLNAYLYAGVIPVPPGYLNTGAGSTWTFNPGHPAPADRLGLQIPIFKSPGDRASRQRNWPNPDPTISCYDDIGTSYVTNMEWWSDPTLPPEFTSKFNEGVRRVNLAFGGANPSYVWIGDQTMDVVPYTTAPVTGEWGKANASVVGFADGRAAYIHLVSNAGAGPGYTLRP